jgi:hypothetical protein
VNFCGEEERFGGGTAEVEYEGIMLNGTELEDLVVFGAL